MIAATPDRRVADLVASGEPPLQLGMVAGEASGDLLAAAVLEGLMAKRPTLQACGMGGPAMRRQGFEPWFSIDELSVRGYVEVLRAYPRLLRLRATLLRRMSDLKPDCFVGIDAPDFNLGLEAALRARSIRTIHFISPSIWAWRAERIESIRRSVDHMLLVFPFEQAIYDRAGIPATYVGHPLADVLEPEPDPARARAQVGISGDAPVVALLPGSRPDEIRYMGELFIETALWLSKQRPDLRFILPAASPALFERLRAMAAQRAGTASINLTIVSGQSHLAMKAADAVLVASGTATLEAALLGRPMVIGYRMAWLSYQIMRGKALLPWIGLPNILCGESLVPEFIQDAASPQALGAALLGQLDDEAGRARLAERFAQMRDGLRRGCAERSAAKILEVCGA